MGTDRIMDVYMINAKGYMIKQYSKNWIVLVIIGCTPLFFNFLYVTQFYAELLKIFKIKSVLKAKILMLLINIEAKKN